MLGIADVVVAAVVVHCTGLAYGAAGHRILLVAGAGALTVYHSIRVAGAGAVSVHGTGLVVAAAAEQSTALVVVGDVAVVLHRTSGWALHQLAV